jgi:DNA helicase II / ATP-dependent DNA helicase PcrA
LVIPNTTEIVRKYLQLLEILNDLRPRELADLIDVLMPAGNEACSAMREAALLDLPKIETIDDLLDCLRSNVTQPVVPEEVDYVRVMSLHKSKGLTSKVVIISGCTQGLIPFVNSDETHKRRRALYANSDDCSMSRSRDAQRHS